MVQFSREYPTRELGLTRVTKLTPSPGFPSPPPAPEKLETALWRLLCAGTNCAAGRCTMSTGHNVVLIQKLKPAHPSLVRRQTLEQGLEP